MHRHASSDVEAGGGGGGRRQAEDGEIRHKSAQSSAEKKQLGFCACWHFRKASKYQGSHSQLFFQTTQSDTLALRGF